jgi:hypothetical protein
MAIPEQVRKQSEAVQELYKQINIDPTQAGEEPTGDQDVGDSEDDIPADENDNDNAAAQVPAGEHTTGASDTEDENSETYAQRWRSLQGSYNATVRQKTELEQRVQNMEQLLSTLSSQAAPQQTNDKEQEPQRLVTDQEAADYGESIDVMRKVSREELVPVAQRLAHIEGLLQQMQANVLPQVQAVAQRQQVSAEQQFWSDLTNFVPNWREVNDEDAFQSWLLDVDPLTGANRQSYLEDAQRSLDAHRVSAFFRTWLESTGQASVAQTPSASTKELEKQVAPGRSRGAGSAATKQPKTYTPDDIKSFFNDVRLGKYKGREQERARIERDIFTAQREGRITNA